MHSVRSGENQCIFFLQQWAISGLTRKEYMRKLKMSITRHLLVVCVTTKPLLSLIWRDIVKNATKSVQANPIDLSCKVYHKKYSTKKILNKHAKLHDKQVSDSQPSTAVSCVVCKKTFLTEKWQRQMLVSDSKGWWSIWIATTWDRNKCTDEFKGTSAAAPLAAGMIALVLETK